MKTTNNQKKQLINNALTYYFNDSLKKYDLIDLIIATLNEKVDPSQDIKQNLNRLKKQQ